MNSIKSAHDFAKAVRDQRKSLNLTQVEVAGLCGVGNRFVVELEQGKPTIELAKAFHIARMLGINFSHTAEGH